jgi:membrane fusion protein (multidrug efflux system)
MKKSLILILVIVAAVGGFFVWKNFYNPAQAQIAPNANNMAMEVNVVVIKKENIQLFKTLPARVSARKIAEVKPQVSGILKKRLFIEGQKVEEGQELYEIDQTLFKIALDSAKVNYNKAHENLKRLKFLVKEEAVSKKEYDEGKTEFARALAELKNAQTNLLYTKVLAPISGYISKSNITEGNLVSINQAEALATIAQLDPIFVDIVQPSKNFSQFRDQNEIAVSLTIDGTDYSETGSLKFSEVFANQVTDSVKLRAEFANPDEKLLPGMFVRAKLHLPNFEGLTVLQRAATRNPDGSLTVVVVDKENIAHTRPIKTKGIFNDSWIVSEGLSEGELVIVEGYQKVRDGMPVKPILQQKSQ